MSATAPSPRVAVVADYLTVRGGAERVAAAMMQAFPDASLLAAMYEPGATFPEFRRHQIDTLWPNRIPAFRHDVRRAFPVLAPAWSRARVGADVTFASSAGWSHAVRTEGRKVVYCHNPARWLYQKDDYFQDFPQVARHVASALDAPLQRWDKKAAHSAHHYLVNSNSVKQRVQQVYGIEAEVLHPPVTLDVDGNQEPPTEIEPGFFLTVSRPRGYKNTALLIDAIASIPDARLVIVGTAPPIPAESKSRITGLRDLSDAQLRWLYANADALLAASYEDFGLTPVEANAFGTPVVALRAGGYLDSVIEGLNGVFFDEPTPGAFAEALGEFKQMSFNADEIRTHAEKFSLAHFVSRLRAIAIE